MKTAFLLLPALLMSVQLAQGQNGGIADKQKWALVIGIAGYEEFPKDQKLKYADLDAKAFADFIETPGGGGFPSRNVHVVTNKDANRQRLFAEFAWLFKNVGPADVVYVFFAGHGADYHGVDYILPSDASQSAPDAMGIEMTKFFTKATSDLRAQQAIVFLDACYAAAATEGHSKGNEGIEAIKDWGDTNDKKGQVRMAFFSSEANQVSWEDDEFKHGLFTYYLLEALEGEARANSEGHIDAGSVWEYVKQNVERRSREKFPRLQTPVVSPRFQNDYLLSIKSRNPFQDALFEWIEAAKGGFRGYGRGRMEIWAPGATLPDADWCSGSDAAAAPSVGCVFRPVQPLERGLSDFDDMIAKTRSSLGKSWQEDDSRKSTFDSRSERRVVFATTSTAAKVTVSLMTTSPEWYQVQVGVVAGPPREGYEADVKPKLEGKPVEISAGQSATLTWDTGGGEAFIVGYGKKVSGKGSAEVKPDGSTQYIMVSPAGGAGFQYTEFDLLVSGAKGGDDFPSLEEFGDAVRGSRFGIGKDYIDFQSSIWSALQDRGYLIRGDYAPKRPFIAFYTNFALRPDLVLGEKISARRLAFAVEISEPDSHATISLAVRAKLEFQNRGEDDWLPDNKNSSIVQAESKKLLQSLERLK